MAGSSRGLPLPPRLLLPQALVLSVALACSCAPALPRPTEPGAAEAYRSLLAVKTDGPRAHEARTLLEQVEFERARQAATVLALRAFLSEFPGGAHAREARVLLESARFSEAARAGSEPGWTGFLQDEPDGAHAQEAWQRLASVRLASAMKAKDPKALRGWLEAFPTHPAQPKARLALEDAELDAALRKAPLERTQPLEAFLAAHPEGARRAEALASLDEATLAEGELLEDEPLLRALGRSPDPLGAKARAAADRVAVERALALLDVERLRELQGVPEAALRARIASVLHELARLGRRAEAQRSQARALYLPAVVTARLPPGPGARARLLAQLGGAQAIERLPDVLAELSSAHPWVQLAALRAAQELLSGLPAGEGVLRARPLLAWLKPLALDGPRLVRASLLAQAASGPEAAREYARAAVGRDDRSLLALVHAARLEQQGGPSSLVWLSANALSAQLLQEARARVQAPTPDRARSKGEDGPSAALLSLCALSDLAAEQVQHLAGRPAPADPEERATRDRALETAKAALAQVSQGRDERERKEGSPGACVREQEALSAARTLPVLARRQAALHLQLAGELASDALDRAKRRDPDALVRGADRVGGR